MKADMRNRLANLLYEAAGQVNNEYPTIEMVAEYLIGNGVIIPPCKVGDTVYYPWIYDGHCGIAFSKVQSINIYVNELPLVIVEDWRSDMPMPISFYSEDFGETVFLTKDQAEQKLKELSENG